MRDVFINLADFDLVHYFYLPFIFLRHASTPELLMNTALHLTAYTAPQHTALRTTTPHVSLYHTTPDYTTVHCIAYTKCCTTLHRAAKRHTTPYQTTPSYPPWREFHKTTWGGGVLYLGRELSDNIESARV